MSKTTTHCGAPVMQSRALLPDPTSSRSARARSRGGRTEYVVMSKDPNGLGHVAVFASKDKEEAADRAAAVSRKAAGWAAVMGCKQGWLWVESSFRGGEET